MQSLITNIVYVHLIFSILCYFLQDLNEEKVNGEKYPPLTEADTSSSNHLDAYQALNDEKCHQENCVTSSGSGTKIALRDFFTVLALSFHSVFEGLAIGLEKKSDIWILFLGKNIRKII